MARTAETMEQFISRNDLTMSCTRLSRRTDGLMDGMPNHWQIRIVKGGHSMTINYSTGSGLPDKPKLANVLECIASESNGIENCQSFEDWADEYGYDHDSRKAERIYKACVKQAAQARFLLGDAEFKNLIYNIDY